PLDAFEALDAGHDLLLAMFDRIAAQQTLPPHAAVVAALDRAGVAPPSTDDDDVDVASASARVIEFPAAPPSRPAPVAPEMPKPAETFAKPEPVRPVPPPPPVAPKAPVREERVAETVARDATTLPADVDPEILDIFFEESDELLETVDHGIHEWLVERDN